MHLNFKFIFLFILLFSPNPGMFDGVFYIQIVKKALQQLRSLIQKHTALSIQTTEG